MKTDACVVKGEVMFKQRQLSLQPGVTPDLRLCRSCWSRLPGGEEPLAEEER